MAKHLNDEMAYLLMTNTGKTERRGRLCTVDLLIKVACFVKKYIVFAISNANCQYKEVNCTEPSPSVRVPWSIFLECFCNQLYNVIIILFCVFQTFVESCFITAPIQLVLTIFRKFKISQNFSEKSDETSLVTNPVIFENQLAMKKS